MGGALISFLIDFVNWMSELYISDDRNNNNNYYYLLVLQAFSPTHWSNHALLQSLIIVD